VEAEEQYATLRPKAKAICDRLVTKVKRGDTEYRFNKKVRKNLSRQLVRMAVRIPNAVCSFTDDHRHSRALYYELYKSYQPKIGWSKWRMPFPSSRSEKVSWTRKGMLPKNPGDVHSGDHLITANKSSLVYHETLFWIRSEVNRLSNSMCFQDLDKPTIRSAFKVFNKARLSVDNFVKGKPSAWKAKMGNLISFWRRQLLKL
jgi:hypothetical protein